MGGRNYHSRPTSPLLSPIGLQDNGRPRTTTPIYDEGNVSAQLDLEMLCKTPTNNIQDMKRLETKTRFDSLIIEDICDVTPDPVSDENKPVMKARSSPVTNVAGASNDDAITGDDGLVATGDDPISDDNVNNNAKPGKAGEPIADLSSLGTALSD